jgi:hypothetical protein
MELTQVAAGGGIAAIMGMVWSHVKTVYQKSTAVIFTRAHFTDNLDGQIVNYLFNNYKRTPKVENLYHGEIRSLKEHGATTVPFRVDMLAGFNYSKRAIISVRYENGFHITAMRGFDFSNFIRQAVLDYRVTQRVKRRDLGCFGIQEITGEEYHVQGNALVAREKRGEIADENGPTAANDYKGFCYSLSFIKHGSLTDKPADFLHETRDPFEDLYLEPHVWEFVEQSRLWFDKQDWYNSRNIPWRRGALLYGLPGCGKSSLVRSLAYDFGVMVYKFNLATLSDQEFMRHWKRMRTPCIALFEDFDSIYNGRKFLIDSGKSLSFDTILNCVSGIDSKEGVFLIITTNNMDTIDPAIGTVSKHDTISSRPGRIDTVVEMGTMNEDNRRKMACRTLCDWPEEVAPAIARGEGLTPAQFQELVLNIALKRLK